MLQREMSKSKRFLSLPHSSLCFCAFSVTLHGWTAAVLLFSLLDQSRSGYCISHSMEDWSAGVHRGVQSRPRHCSLSLHVRLFFRLFFRLCLSLTIPAWWRPLCNTSWDQANECHHCARKVITASGALTHTGQIEPFIVHIKAVSLP